MATKKSPILSAARTAAATYLAALTRRSGQLASIHGDVVYSDDEVWSHEYGSNQHLRHRPGPRKGNRIGAYCHVKLNLGDGITAEGHRFMSMDEIIAHRNQHSQGWKMAVKFGKTADSQWNEKNPQFEAMAIKTVVRALANRGELPMSIEFMEAMQVVRTPGLHAMRFYRPLIHWTAQNVFSFAAAFGVEPNPLYLQGMGRVGCFPCINAAKSEIRAIAIRYPEAIDRIAEWEAICAATSKRGGGTFFAADVTPEGAALGKRISAIADPEERRKASGAAPWPNARTVAEWARTDRGGAQFNWIMDAEDDGLSCSSQYGLCE